MSVGVGAIGAAALLAWLIVPLRVHLEMPANAYKSWIDRIIVSTGYTIRGRAPPCLVAGGGRWDGSIEDLVDTLPWEQCLQFTEQRRWRGLWDSGWEWSIFCADTKHKCRTFPEKGNAWLVFSEGAYNGPDLPDGLYRIEFIGRRTAQPGAFGHLNQYDYEMIVDQVVSIRKIPGEVYTKRF